TGTQHRRTASFLVMLGCRLGQDQFTVLAQDDQPFPGADHRAAAEALFRPLNFASFPVNAVQACLALLTAVETEEIAVLVDARAIVIRHGLVVGPDLLETRVAGGQ